MQTIRDKIVEILRAEHPMTIRQIYYRLVAANIIAKTEAEYKGTVCRLIATMRRESIVPFRWISDNTRWMLKPKSYRSLKDALSKTQRDYRRAIWDSQNVYVEFWAESDAVAGVLYDVTAKWDVPLMVSRGYSSLTFLQSAAIDIASIDKPAYLYHFGDHDPSGRDIGRHIEFTIREFAPEADVHFVTVAVTPAQIKKWNLPSRPTKKSDTRAKGFVGNSVEIEAIPVKKLRDLAERCILKHIDQWTLDRLQTVENTERDTLKTILQQFQESNVDA